MSAEKPRGFCSGVFLLPIGVRSSMPFPEMSLSDTECGPASLPREFFRILEIFPLLSRLASDLTVTCNSSAYSQIRFRADAEKASSRLAALTLSLNASRAAGLVHSAIIRYSPAYPSRPAAWASRV